MARSDRPLIRHLFERRGPATASAWQRPPLVLLPGEGFVRYLLEHESELMEVMPTIEHLPWEEVVFDYQGGREVITAMMRGTLPADPALADRGQCWIRVCSMDRYARTARVASPWLSGPYDLLAPFTGVQDAWLAIEAWEASVLRPASSEPGFPAYPDVSIIPRDHPWDFAAVAHLYPNLRCRQGRAYGDGHGFCNLTRCKYPGALDPAAIACHSSELVMSAGVRLALLTLAYLMQCDEHLVEVSPARPPDPTKEQKAGKIKPWTRSLPHVILLDPQRVGEYRESVAERDGHSTHASPRPHQRRGHWRVLRAERYVHGGPPRRVYVRPARVGDRHWTFEGQRYRVVEPMGAGL